MISSLLMVITGALALVAGAAAQAVSGTDILNFALQLECLEAEFYSYAAYGVGLTDALRGGGPEPIGGQMAQLTGDYQAVAQEIANNEIKHVELLRTALGDAAVPCPLIDIGSAFVAAANAATNSTLDPPFNPYANNVFFLHAAFIFEDVGVTAYKGAIEPLVGLVEPATVSIAAGILAVEAYHAGIVRDQLVALNSIGEVKPYGLPISAVVQAISNLRDAVDGPADMDVGIVSPNDFLTLVPTDENALVYDRSVAQVLAIVYLGSADLPGGFFPEGLNGFFGPSGPGAGGMAAVMDASMMDVSMATAPTGSDSMEDATMSESGSDSDCVAANEQCGGNGYTGPTCCPSDYTCFPVNAFYSGCKKDTVVLLMTSGSQGSMN